MLILLAAKPAAPKPVQTTETLLSAAVQVAMAESESSTVIDTWPAVEMTPVEAPKAKPRRRHRKTQE